MHKHKAWSMSSLRSRDLTSVHPKRASFRVAAGPSEMVQKTSKKLPFTAILVQFVCDTLFQARRGTVARTTPVLNQARIGTRMSAKGV